MVENLNKEITQLNLDSYDGNEPYIFVSYSHADTKEVYKILKIIEKEKYRFWYDDTMEIGEDFREELRSRIVNCSAFLIFISDASMASKYCGMEIITAYKYDKKIYPVYLNESVQIPAPLKMILENLQHLKNQNDEKYIYKLISGLPIETMRSLQTEGDVLVKCKDGSTSLAIPSGVRIIGNNAFKNCESLEKIDFGQEVAQINKEAFRGCKSLKSVYLPSNIKKVGESAFRDCVSLKSLTVVGDGLEISERCFENCASLKNIELENSITELYSGVFNSCKSLETIKLPEKLTILGESAFADCAQLKEIVIPDPVTKIDDMVFSGCLNLQTIKLNSDLNKIGKNAFKDCQSLLDIYIPQKVNNIGYGVFRGCTSLRSVEVDSKNKFFKTVNNVLFNKNKSSLISYAVNDGEDFYEIPDSVMLICDWAFYGSNLKHIIIPDSVTEIGEGAFCNCTELEELVLPDSIIRIDDSAFRGCSSLKRFVIPDSVIEYGWGMLSGCNNVTVVCNNNSPAAKYCESKGIPYTTK